jgi:hypothetical protein
MLYVYTILIIFNMPIKYHISRSIIVVNIQ